MASQSQPLIETTRLRLRPMQPEDTDALLQIFADPLVMAAFNEPPFTREQMQCWLQSNLEHQSRHGYGLFAVMLKSEDVLIGDCGLEWMEVEGVAVAELGYDFRSAYWNQGYATEAATAVRDYAMQTLGLPQLLSLIHVGNLGSQRVAEKIGMRLVGELIRYGRPYWKYRLENKT